jgi:hypothetical protein
MNKFNIKKLFIVNFFLILFGALFLNIYIDKDRFLIKYPDDNYHALIKSVILKNCENIDNDNCIGINRLNNINSNDLEENVKFDFERQRHRLLVSYHPLYTFLLNKFFINNEIFYAQKIFHYFLATILAFLIFYYVNIFFKNQKIAFLVILIYITHFFLKGAQGFHFAIPATISAFLSTLGIIFLFNKKKYLFYIFIFLSVLMHHVGLLFTISNYLAIKIYDFYFKNNFKSFLSKENLLQYIFVLILLIFAYNLNYIFFSKNYNSFNAYDLNFEKFDILKIISSNFYILIKYFLLTAFLLNPLSIYFFTKFFLKKNKNIILLLKIIFVISLVSIIITPIGSSDSRITFAYGNRTWEIFVLNFLILFFSFISKIKNKIDIILKYIFFYSIPFFVCINILLLNDRVNFIKKYDNFYHDNKIFMKFLLNTKNTDKILIDLDEANFYYLLNNGIVNKNFFIKKITNSSETKNFDYIIIENPLKLTNRSSVVINNMDRIAVNKSYNYQSFIFYSLKKQKISINGKFYEINIGVNNLILLSGNFIFHDLDSPIYLIGIKTDNNQSSNWPWYSDFKFTIYTKISKWSIFLDKSVDYVKEYDFKEISKKLNTYNNLNCKNKLLSDVDAVLIFKSICN